VERPRVQRTAVHELILSRCKPKGVELFMRPHRLKPVSRINSTDDNSSSSGILQMHDVPQPVPTTVSEPAPRIQGQWAWILASIRPPRRHLLKVPWTLRT